MNDLHQCKHCGNLINSDGHMCPTLIQEANNNLAEVSQVVYLNAQDREQAIYSAGARNVWSV